MEIKQDMFWRMYNALKDSEYILWDCNGSVNPENEELTNEIVELSELISNLLNDLQPVIKEIKEEQCKSL
jgi:hypothetical protein